MATNRHARHGDATMALAAQCDPDRHRAYLHLVDQRTCPPGERDVPLRIDDPGAAYPGSNLQTARLAVRRAWRAVFGGGSPSADATLKDAGCNALSLLQFVSALEYTLGRKVPLDIIDVGMRADDVAAALSTVHGMPPAHDQRPLVFLMPGLDDDEQRLALFRTALRDRVRFHLVEYPDWPEMARLNWGFSDLAASIERQVLAH